MRAADARPANMRRTQGSAAVPAKPAAMSTKACEVSAAPVSAAACPEAYSAAVPAKPAAMSAKACEVSAAPAAGVCFKCEKRHDEEQHRGHASAGRQRQLHGAGTGRAAPPRSAEPCHNLHERRASNTDTGIFPSIPAAALVFGRTIVTPLELARDLLKPARPKPRTGVGLPPCALTFGLSSPPYSRSWSSRDTCKNDRDTQRICADDPSASVCQR
jgi:hypothetical protein